MLGFNGLIGIALVYVVFLFGVAFAAERRAATGRDGWLRSPGPTRCRCRSTAPPGPSTARLATRRAQVSNI